MTERKLPTLAELHADLPAAIKNDKLNCLLHQPPSASWLKKFPPEMKIKGEYLPIDKVQILLTTIFQEWYPEVISYSALFNAVAVHVRLHYKNPLTLEWQFKDGVGAAPIQVDAGKSASDLSAIKSKAIQIALPIAKTAAIKDAAEELGPLFGRDLNRKDTIMFTGKYLADGPANEAPQTNLSAL